MRQESIFHRFSATYLKFGAHETVGVDLSVSTDFANRFGFEVRMGARPSDDCEAATAHPVSAVDGAPAAIARRRSNA